MKFLFSLILFFGGMQSCIAQSCTIKGSVADTLNLTKLYKASVTIMKPTDSGIVAHTRTAPDGSFELKVDTQGRYIIRVAFINFGDYEDVIIVNKPVLDLGEMPMLTKEHLLKEFVITQQIAAIKIKGDTTEYMADSFKVKDGANVEDLLRRLPGIQVDKNGKITAQGETVQKVLVDGEEFFSDDPKVVTQGLQAVVVNKVQVYDKKSDQAEFTGIDDGQKTKTINLELKEDRKKGYFGKLDAGQGTDGYYQDQGMINAFKGKRQLSAFMIASNTDKVGLGWGDNDKFGGGAGITEMTDNGYYSMVGGSYDEFGGWNGNYEGEGLPSVLTGGIHYANRWNEDASHLSGSYRYANQDVNIQGDNTTQSSLAGDTVRINTEHKTQPSKIERHGFNGFYEWKIDTNNSLRLVLYAGLKNADVSSRYHTTTYNMVGDALPVTTNDRLLTGNTHSENIDLDLLYKKKFKKKGRTISVGIEEQYNASKGYGYLNSTLSSPDTLIPGKMDTTITNQEKTDTSHTLSFNSKVTYTEPLSKTAFLEVNYGLYLINSSSEKNSWNLDSTTRKYDLKSDSFSSNYKYNIMTNRGGLSFKFVYKNYNFSFGTDVANTNYLQKDIQQTEILGHDVSRTYNYPNLYPKANFTYKFGKQTSLRFNYDGSTKQPTIAQIQPLSQNTDPLNITVGNPNLKQEFNNNFRLNFSDYKILSQRYFYVGLSGNTDFNAISTSQTTDGPISTIKYINVDGNYSTNGYIGYDFKIKKPDLSIGFSLDGNQSHTNNIINGLNNSSNNTSLNIGPNFRKDKEDKYNFSWEPHIAYNENYSTISTFVTRYYTFNSDFRADVQITKKWSVGTTANAMIRQKTVVFPTNNEVIKWNAYMSRKFLKKNQLEIKAMVYDILNQNTGFTRTASGSTISQINYNTIRRYGMLNLVWNFTHTPGGMAAAEEKK